MGNSCSNCVLESDMATEIEAELDEHDYNDPQKSDSVSCNTSLLAASEVVLHRIIGDGPSGVVHIGSYRGSVVAVKKYPVLDTIDAKVESALEMEATRMGSLRHPNIVLFMGACVQDTAFAIVSEYCTRGSLFDVLNALTSHRDHHSKSSTSRNRSISGPNDGPVDLQWTLRLRLALGAARGLLYLHSADPALVHGQLKSTNILVDDSWNAKLADFSTNSLLVHLSQSRLEICSSAGASLKRWTAPEMWNDTTNTPACCRQAVDVYGFGMVMWELTTGKVPFADLDTNEDICDRVLSGIRPAIQPSLCSLEWAQVMIKCWAQEPHDRPTTSEIVSILEDMKKAQKIR